MRNVDLHIDETQAIGIRELRGEVVRTHPDVPAALDDSKSFTVRVTSGMRPADRHWRWPRATCRSPRAV